MVHIHGFYGRKIRIRPTGSKGLCFIGLWYIISRVQYNTTQYSTVQYSTTVKIIYDKDSVAIAIRSLKDKFVTIVSLTLVLI